MTVLRRPAPTIRFRLTAAYGGLFLGCGTGLLAITYFLVRRQYSGKFFITAGKKVDTPTELPNGTVLFHKALHAAAHAQSAAATHQLLVDSGVALAVMAILSIWFGWLLAGRALRPLRTITNTARTISATNLHQRLALEGPEDELKELGSTFDSLLERLEAAFKAQRQFVANASHELRTPLTLERALLEVALSDPHANAATLREACEKVLVVGREQEHLIEALLTLSRSQRGIDVHEPVDVASLAEAVARTVDRDGLVFNTDFAPARTTGDPRLIERLAVNLIDNAVKHNHPGGVVTIETHEHAGRAILRVRNSGDEISAEDVSRLLEPFERLERDCNGSGGLGLGLSIVDAIAKAHCAIVNASPEPGGGLDVEVAFLANEEDQLKSSPAPVVTAG